MNDAISSKQKQTQQIWLNLFLHQSAMFIVSRMLSHYWYAIENTKPE